MDTEFIRSWCLDFPETTLEYSGNNEIYKVRNKTFAIIEQGRVSLKCEKETYHTHLMHPDISPAKKLARHHWITINRYALFKIEEILERVIVSYEQVAAQFSKKIRQTLLKKLRHDIDSPWKDVIDLYFKEFMIFFYPDIARDIDWSKAPIFMDKELSKITTDAKTGIRYVDKLVKVWRKNGEETWVLLHIEVQGQPQDIFPERMFTYATRLRDRYQLMVVSMAILADDDPNLLRLTLFEPIIPTLFELFFL